MNENDKYGIISQLLRRGRQVDVRYVSGWQACVIDKNGREFNIMDPSWDIGTFFGSDKLRRSSRDDKSRTVFVVGFGISLRLIPSASMAPANVTARSRGPQSPHRGHAIRWHGPAVFDNLYC